MKETIQERSEDYEFSFIADNYAVDFANTISSYLTLSPTDHIANYADLSAWGVEAGLISEDERQELLTEAARKSDEAARIVKRAHRLRDAIYRIFVALEDGKQSSDEDLRVLNRELATALAHVCLERKDRTEYEWGWSGLGQSLDGILWPVARAAADLLTSEEKQKVSACAGETCGWLFLDKSRNHSRQWCDMSGCGNRAKASRHYHRKRVASA